jgi:hypothetical protein
MDNGTIEILDEVITSSYVKYDCVVIPEVWFPFIKKYLFMDMFGV